MATPPKKPTRSTKKATRPTPKAAAKKRSSKAKKPDAPIKKAGPPKKRKTAAASTASATKRSPKKPRAPRRPGPVTTKARPPRNWRRSIIREVAFIGIAASCGLMVTGAFLWSRAQRDVAHYLANPPQTTPGMIYSAPIELREGQQTTLTDVGSHLLAAGYERVEDLQGPNQFRVTSDSSLEIWNPKNTATLTNGKVTLRFSGNELNAVDPGVKAILHPMVLATIGDTEGRRSPVSLTQLSKWMEPALLAMEDSRFREHRGVDPKGILRALAHNLMGYDGMHGGSTLTQQLAKNLFLSSERTLQRKIREAFFAASLEANLSKDELLELYLSEVYLGQAGGIPLHGVEQAARAWFGVSAARLGLGQAATIAGIISAPNRYSPARHPERAMERRNLVLQRMVDEGSIDDSQASAIADTNLTVITNLSIGSRSAPWAVDVAIDHAESELGSGALFSSGHSVYTSLQPLLQRAAEQAVAQGLAELDMAYPKAAGAEAALVAVRVSDGAIVAIVGGRNYGKSAFNRATHAWRQAGSTVKPLTLLTAFEEDANLSPISRVMDEPITRTIDGKSWHPQNYDRQYLGEITLRKAIEGSRNIPAITLAEEVGFEDLYDSFRRLGLSKATILPSASLGAFRTNTVEMAGAYAVFAGGGTITRPHLVERIADRNNETLSSNANKPMAVASNRATALATHVLRGVMTHGTGSRAKLYGAEGPVAGKTGTTDDYRDAWFTGVTPELAIAVWVGKDRGTLGLAGSRAALPIWARFAVASGTIQGDFPQPEGLETATVSHLTGLVVNDDCPHTYQELFRAGNIPPKSKSCDRDQPIVPEITRVFSQLFGRKKIRKDGDEGMNKPN